MVGLSPFPAERACHCFASIVKGRSSLGCRLALGLGLDHPLYISSNTVEPPRRTIHVTSKESDALTTQYAPLRYSNIVAYATAFETGQSPMGRSMKAILSLVMSNVAILSTIVELENFWMRRLMKSNTFTLIIERRRPLDYSRARRIPYGTFDERHISRDTVGCPDCLNYS